MFNLFLTTIFALVLTVTAAAVNQAHSVDTHILVPMNLCVKMCMDVSYGGFCKKLCGTPGLCYPIPAPLAGQVSSLSLANDVSSCSVFETDNCNSQASGDSIKDLQGEVPWIGAAMNDKIRSYYCY